MSTRPASAAATRKTPPDHWDPHETTIRLSENQPKFKCVLQWARGNRILDLGCNDGALVDRLQEGGVFAVGGDRFAYARVASQTYAIPVLALDAEQPLPFAAESFDTVVVSGLLEYVDDSRSVLREVRRILIPAGRLILIAPNANSLGRTLRRRLRGQTPETRYDQREWENMLADAGFAIRELRYCPYKVTSGRARLLYWAELVWLSRWATDFAFFCEPLTGEEFARQQ